VKVFCSNLHV